MNPNMYHQSVSPQPPASLTAREQAARAMMYQNPYGTAQELARLHQVAGSSFGFIHHHQAAAAMAGNPYAQAYAQFHNQQQALNEMAQAQAQAQQHGGRNSLEPPRSVSPSRRRPSMLQDYDREGRYRAVSPPESRSPSVQRGHQVPGSSHPRPPSPRQPLHQSGGNTNSVHLSNNNYPSTSRQEYLREPQDNYRQASKKMRMQDEIHRAMNVSDMYGRGGSGKPELRGQDYAPRLVEAISPPSAEENEVDRACQVVEAEIRDLENNMRSCVKNVDQWEAELKAAEARKEECERARKSHAELARPSTPESSVTGDVVRRIITENRRIAESEHVSASKKFSLTVPAQTPYQHPAGMADVMQVLKDFQKQRPGIILRLKKDRQAKQIRERYLKERYKQLSQAYVSRLEKVENNPKKKNREGKMREYYERQFPEIKKIRDDKLRDSRLSRKSDAESDMSGTEDTPLDLERYQRSAVLVPMLLDAKDRSRHYYDRNRIVENCALDYKEALANAFWTQEEKDIFKEKYLQRPKDFGYISSFLKRKSVTDCVQYYYLTKRKENYKQMVKKQKAYRIRRGPNKRLQSADEPVSPNKMINSGMPLSMLGAHSLRLSSLAELNSVDGEDVHVRAITLTIVCPARKCQARRRVIKRLFKIPADFPNYLAPCQSLELPETATSCCKYCVYYIEKRLGLKKWSTSEIETLKKALIAHGSNWNLIAKNVATKRIRDCLQYYRLHAAELAPPGDNVSMPPLPPPDDEYSPWSRSSSDEADEMAARDKITDVPAERSDLPPMIRMHSDDSNATLSADEMDDEPEPPPHQYLSTLPRSSRMSNSFSPGNLPEPRGFGSENHRNAPGSSGSNGPACVRDLIHSAIEKNLDKDRPFAAGGGYADDFRRRLENTALTINSPRDRFGERRGEVDVGMLARSMEDPLSRLRLPNVVPPGGAKSPNNRPSASASPGRRDMSPLPEEGRRMSGNIGQNVQQAYQYSTRQNLLTDFATSRQIHAEQVNHNHPAEGRPGGQGQFENHQNAPPGPDPRFLPTFYSPYASIYLPNIPYSTMITPEYMEQLAQGAFPMGLAGMPGIMPQRGMAPQQQRSIMLGTGKPGISEDNNSLQDRESASRLQTLAANRGLIPSDKRGKPEVITIDESRRDNHSPSTSDMRFHPAQHHLPPKAESSPEKEPGSNVTAGSLIDVIIARQISTPSRGGEHNPGHGNGPSASAGNARMVIKREEPMGMHKPFTLGEHIEQIIAKDFSKKDSGPSHLMPRPVGVASPLNPMGSSPVGGIFPPFSMAQTAQMNPGNWKRRARVDEQPPPQQAQAVYAKPNSSTLASTVEYEPISPPENRGSDSEEEGVVRNGATGDKSN